MINKSLNNNLIVRKAISENGVRYWQVAKELGIHKNAFSEMLREELEESKQIEIAELCKKMKEDGVC